MHRVSSLCKRWLLGTHQGRVAPAHLQAYLNEFTFRYNHRMDSEPMFRTLLLRAASGR